MKMLKKIFTFTIIFCFFFTDVYALGENGGSNGGGTGSGYNEQNTSSPGNSSALNDNTYDHTWAQNGNMVLAAYRFDLVYKPKNGKRKIIKTLIVQGNEQLFGSGFNTWVWGQMSGAIKQNYRHRVEDYAEFLNSKAVKELYGSDYKGARYIYDENMKSSDGCRFKIVADKLTQGVSIEDIIVNSNDSQFSINNKMNIEHYLTSNACFGLNAKDFQLEQDYSEKNGKDINSYGYRILIQKLQLFTTGAADSAALKQCASYAATRNDVADPNSTFYKKMLNFYQTKTVEDGKGDGNMAYGEGNCGSGINSFWWKENLFSGTNISVAYKYLSTKELLPAGDLYTHWDDIGIKKPSDSLVGKLVNATTKEKSNADAKKTLNSTEMRQAFGDDNNGLGYNIIWFSTEQFVPDYSLDAACVNCNSNDKDNKSYFIQDTSDWKAIEKSKEYSASNQSITNNIRNYYYKTKDTYCRESYMVKFPNINDTIVAQTGRYFTLNVSDDDKKNIAGYIPNFKPVKVIKIRQCKGGDLNQFAKTSKNSFLTYTGTVYAKYTENTDNSKYSTSKIELKRYSKADDFSSSISGDMLTMSATYSYTLPDNFYRYIRKTDGLSIKHFDDKENIDKYTDLKVSNFPISFTNYSRNVGYVQFSYDLPTGDKNSKMSYAYNNGKNDVLLDTNNKVLSIYKKYLSIKNKSLSSAFWKDEDTVAIQNSACSVMFGYGTEGFESCVKQRQTNKAGDGDDNCYKKINENIDGTGNDSVSKGYSCLIISKNKCQYDIITNKFYNDEGQEISEEDYHNGKCEADNAPGECAVVYNYETNSTDYYGPDGKKLVPNTSEKYNEVCPSECPTDCEYGCCPSGECAPMPTDSNGMIICPGTGGRKVIYRTIDLQQPFPGQGAEKRKTGSNWCSYDVKTQKLDCNWDNNVSKAYILKKGKKVHNSDHVLYKVTLNSETISKIRKYNDSHKYDDWDLSCTNGRKCTSSFLKNEVTVTGKCANVTKSNFESCAKIKVS